jgi:hypothetical protein
MALASSGDVLELSPDAEAIRAFLGEHGRGVALGRLASFFGRLDKGPLAATPEELEAFVAKGLGGLAPATRDAYLTSVRRFYRSAFAEAQVSLAVMTVVAAREDACELSLDADAIHAFLDHDRDRRASAALEALAWFFLRRGKGPLDATPEELEEFRTTIRRRFTSGVNHGYRRVIGRFYEPYALSGRVSIAAAVAIGVDGLAISPDREWIREFMERRGAGQKHMCRAALRVVADFCLRQGKSVFDVTADDVVQILGRELRYLDHDRRYFYGKWIRAFYRSAWEVRRISVQAAKVARVVRPEETGEIA